MGSEAGLVRTWEISISGAVAGSLGTSTVDALESPEKSRLVSVLEPGTLLAAPIGEPSPSWSTEMSCIRSLSIVGGQAMTLEGGSLGSPIVSLEPIPFVS